MLKTTPNPVLMPVLLVGGALCAAEPPDALKVARDVDGLIFAAENTSALQSVDDATYLRRVSLDLIGRPPTAGDLTRFGLDPSADKRRTLTQRLLLTSDYADCWSRYWRDAIFRRATNVRANLVRPAFEKWMAENLQQNRPWDAIVSDLLTAKGKVNNDGSTALVFIHEGAAEEIAAEASRLFLGVQIQCANCHDHPWDRWKREQFHELVAFFPRITLRRDPQSDNMLEYVIESTDRERSRRTGVSEYYLRRIDRNRDGIISEAEAKGTNLARVFTAQARAYVDSNKDDRISIKEILTARPPNNNRPGQGATEHYMVDLANPSAKGTRVTPAFFVNERAVPDGLPDARRRQTIAELITDKSNPWFAKAIVNRMWAELTGSAFYEPVDDIGPDRTADHENALDLLCDGFVRSNYDLRWLMTAITGTSFYQRPINTDAEGFLRLEPSRLRADQFYSALCQALNVKSLPFRSNTGRVRYAQGQDLGRLQFAATFGFDPSTPRSDLTGNIPEALFMMNSPQLNLLLKANSSNSTIARISRQVVTDEDVVHELYLATLSREPTDEEVSICMQFIGNADSRHEGFEDIFWSLLNSSEFQSKR